MMNSKVKLVAIGDGLASRLSEVTNAVIAPQDESSEIDGAATNTPLIVIADVVDLKPSGISALEQHFKKRDLGAQIAIMGVLSWGSLDSTATQSVKSADLTKFDDLLLLPSKPFEVDLRLAKLTHTATLRGTLVNTFLSFGRIRFDCQNMTVEVDGKHLRLTRKETEFLLFMARNADTVVTKDHIAKCVWRTDEVSHSFDNVLNGHMSRLREKLGDAGCWGLLKTVRKSGFMFSISSAQFKDKGFV